MKYLYSLIIYLLVIPLLNAQKSTQYIVKKEVNFRYKPDTKLGGLIEKLHPNDTVWATEVIEQAEKDMRWVKGKISDGREGFVAIRSGNDVYLEELSKDLGEEKICSYFMFSGVSGKKTKPPIFIGGVPNKEKEIDYIIKDIEFIVTLSANCKVLDDHSLRDNCAALRVNDTNLIIINTHFFAKISNSYLSLAPIYIILAHELAHHFNYHLSKKEPGIQEELEADEFAGKILRSIGLNKVELDETLKFLDNYPHGGTHPTLIARKERIKKGWLESPEFPDERTMRNKYEKLYDGVSAYKNGFAGVKKNGMYGFINQLGREVITPQFEKIEMFDKNRLARVKPFKGDWYYITPSGKKM
jgi:hypothetical protein